MKFVRRAGLVGTAVGALLAGCGGGGSEEGTAQAAATRETAAALATGFTITGTASTGGDSLAGFKVRAKCVGGEGAAFVNTKGKFAIKATGQLPCVHGGQRGQPVLGLLAEQQRHSR